MPDFERLQRSLEIDLADSPEAAAYLRGKHAGEDRARKQIVWLAAIIACAAMTFVVTY